MNDRGDPGDEMFCRLGQPSSGGWCFGLRELHMYTLLVIYFNRCFLIAHDHVMVSHSLTTSDPYWTLRNATTLCIRGKRNKGCILLLEVSRTAGAYRVLHIKGARRPIVPSRASVSSGMIQACFDGTRGEEGPTPPHIST